MSFTNFTTGQAHSFGGEYLELIPFEKIRDKDKFDDPQLIENAMSELAKRGLKKHRRKEPGQIR
ncbi:MAG: hypothetical protein ACXWT7_02850 [Methylophilaceae bacterium]